MRAMQLIASVTTVVFVAVLVTPAWAGPDDSLPPDPGAEKVPSDDSWAYGTVGPEELPDMEEPYEGDNVCLTVSFGAPELRVTGLELLPGGILMSEAKAMRCAQYKVAYDELRALYELDLKGWTLNEEVYQKQLKKADKEIVSLNKELGSTWNRYKFAIGLGIGFLLSTILAICATVVVVYLK